MKTPVSGHTIITFLGPERLFLFVYSMAQFSQLHYRNGLIHKLFFKQDYIHSLFIVLFKETKDPTLLYSVRKYTKRSVPCFHHPLICITDAFTLGCGMHLEAMKVYSHCVSSFPRNSNMVELHMMKCTLKSFLSHIKGWIVRGATHTQYPSQLLE